MSLTSWLDERGCASAEGPLAENGIMLVEDLQSLDAGDLAVMGLAPQMVQRLSRELDDGADDDDDILPGGSESALPQFGRTRSPEPSDDEEQPAEASTRGRQSSVLQDWLSQVGLTEEDEELLSSNGIMFYNDFNGLHAEDLLELGVSTEGTARLCTALGRNGSR